MMKTNQKDRTLELMYSPRELMAFLGVSRSSVYRWLRSGQLKSVKLGGSRRISRSDIEDFISSSEVTN